MLPDNDMCAYADSDIEKKLEEEVERKLTDLDTHELDEYFNYLDENLKTSFGGSIKNLIAEILNGEAELGSGKIVEFLVKSASGFFSTSCASLIGIALLSILYSMSGQLTSGFKKESTRQIVYWAVYGGIAVTVAITVSNLILEMKTVINTISKIIEAGMPIFATLITALGGSGASAFLAPSVSLICGVAVKVVISFVLPLFYAVTVFTIIGNMSDNIKLDKLSKALRSVGSWTLGVMFSVIAALVSAQGLAGASLDTVSIKSAKFALSSYIPILGGYLAEGFDIVCAGAVMVKNAFGLAVLLLIIASVLTPILKTICYSLALKLLAGFLEPVTDSKVTNLLYVTAQNITLPIAACAGIGFLVFIMFTVLIGAFNAGVV